LTYENCDAVRAAGADPILRGDPGYGSHLDRDGDGVDGAAFWLGRSAPGSTRPDNRRGTVTIGSPVTSRQRPAPRFDRKKQPSAGRRTARRRKFLGHLADLDHFGWVDAQRQDVFGRSLRVFRSQPMH
jgi:hypothetical protein